MAFAGEARRFAVSCAQLSPPLGAATRNCAFERRSGPVVKAMYVRLRCGLHASAHWLWRGTALRMVYGAARFFLYAGREPLGFWFFRTIFVLRPGLNQHPLAALPTGRSQWPASESGRRACLRECDASPRERIHPPACLAICLRERLLLRARLSRDPACPPIRLRARHADVGAEFAPQLRARRGAPSAYLGNDAWQNGASPASNMKRVVRSNCRRRGYAVSLFSSTRRRQPFPSTSVSAPSLAYRRLPEPSSAICEFRAPSSPRSGPARVDAQTS